MLSPLEFIRLLILNMAILLPLAGSSSAISIHTQRELQKLQDQSAKDAGAYQSIINKIFDKNTQRQMAAVVEAQRDLVEGSLQKSKVDSLSRFNPLSKGAPRAKALAVLNRGNSSRCSLNQDCAHTNPRLNSMKNDTPPSDFQPLVFISSSMPITALQELALEAKRQGARLIIRGMVNHSMKETGNLAKEINHPLDIDPTLFKKFDVRQVPTFALPYENDGIPEWRIIRGNVTLTYALAYTLEKTAAKDFREGEGRSDRASPDIHAIGESQK